MAAFKPRPIPYTGQIVCLGSALFFAISSLPKATSLPLVAAILTGVIMTSPDGVKWTRRFSGTRRNLYSITFGNGLFVSVGDSGTICTSADVKVWKAQRSGTDILLCAIVAGNGVFVAGGESGATMISSNGTHWISGNLGVPIYVGKISFRAGKFVTRGDRTFVSQCGLVWR